MTSNSQLKRKNIDLKMENDNLRNLRWALLADNRRLQAERDEARDWARRMMKERDEARREFTLIMADLIQHRYAEYKGVRFTVIDKRESE